MKTDYSEAIIAYERACAARDKAKPYKPCQTAKAALHAERACKLYEGIIR